MRDEANGFSTAWMLGLSFLILLAGLAFFTFSGALSARQQLVSIADRAANAGATAIDEDVLVSSDGDTVELNEAESEARCNDVILRAAQTSRAKIESGSFECLRGSGTEANVIYVSLTGEVDYGIMARWLGSEKGKFTITSSARPSCSDGSC